jgi:hypothetical protein
VTSPDPRPPRKVPDVDQLPRPAWIERELDLAFDRSADAMDGARDRGELSPERIARSIREFRGRRVVPGKDGSLP